MSYNVTNSPTSDYATKKFREIFKKYEPFFSSVGFALLLFDECSKSTAKVKFHRRLTVTDFKEGEKIKLIKIFKELKNDLDDELKFIK